MAVFHVDLMSKSVSTVDEILNTNYCVGIMYITFDYLILIIYNDVCCNEPLLKEFVGIYPMRTLVYGWR